MTAVPFEDDPTFDLDALAAAEDAARAARHASDGRIIPFDSAALEASDSALALGVERQRVGGPRVDMERGICRVTWEAPVSVTFEFDRYDAGRSGETRAEVSVYDTTAVGRRLHRATLNLSASRSRSEIAGLLRKRDMRGRNDWPDLVEEAVAAAVDAHREGEPERLLSEIDPSAATARLLPFVLDGHVLTILHGDGGNGKSTIALASAIAIHTGRADIIGIAPTSRRRALYLDWESDGAEPASRIGQLLGAPLGDLYHVRCSRALWDETDRLRRIISRRRAELVVIDSVGLACGGIPPETSEAALRFAAALRSLDVGALGIAHVTKSASATSEDYPFGSVFWRNTARASWLVKREQEISATRFTVGLVQKKANTGPAAPPLAFEVSYEDGLRITPRDAMDVPDVAAALPIKFRIQHVLTEPMTVTAIASAVDASADSVNRTLNRWKGKVFAQASGPDGVVRWAKLRIEERAS